MLLINLLYGKMITNKLFALHRLIDLYNHYKDTTIEKKRFNTEPVTSNA